MLVDLAIKNHLKLSSKYKHRPKSGNTTRTQVTIEDNLFITKIRRDLDESFESNNKGLAVRPQSSLNRSQARLSEEKCSKKRKIRSALALRQVRESNYKSFIIKKPRSPSPHKQHEPQLPSNSCPSIVRQNFNLNDLCAEPKRPRFTSLLSIDAQYAMLMTYEELIRDKLLREYPQYTSLLLKTATPRFKSTTGVYVDPLRVTHFINAAMKIIDLMSNFKRNVDINKNPLLLYNQWVYLWNKEFYL